MLNKAIVMGRLAADPELKHTSSNIPVTTFRIAVDRSFARPGETRETDWLDIVAWRSTAEFVSRNFRKGMQVAVSGRIQTRRWQDNNGNNRISWEIVADEVFFADSRRSDDGSRGPAFAGGSADDFIETQDDTLPF